MATELVKGKHISEAMQVTNKAVMEALDGLPPVKYTVLYWQRRQSMQRCGIMQRSTDQDRGLQKPKNDISEGEEAEEEEY